MSLRSKVVSALLGVFLLYVFAAWLVLVFIHTPAFDSLEKNNASDQLLRVHEFIEAESADLDLLILDWAEWDETMMFVQGENEQFFEDNLADGYLGELGMSFGVIVDMEGRQIWGQAYPEDGTISSLDYLFPGGIPKNSRLVSPVEFDEQVSGLIDTALGPAIVSSAAILWSDRTGPAGGHMIAGKLLDAEKMDTIGHTVLSTIDLLPVIPAAVPQEFLQALNELVMADKPYSMVKQGDHLFSLKLLRDIEGQNLALLRVRGEADISKLGTRTLRITILMLVVAALVLTLTLWFVLKGMLLLPIEHLTAVLRGKNDAEESEEDGGYLLTTMQRLTDSRGSISQRNDEIGELISAFDDLSTSLKDATTNVWRIAHFDALTGLANRHFLMERLGSIIESRQDQLKVAVLFIDLDDFKIVNDQLGHEAGDKLLVEVASRIRSVIRADNFVIGQEDDGNNDLVARIGGDEFVVLLSSGDLPECADNIAARIVESVAAPYVIGDADCQIGACIGIAILPEDASDLTQILANADTAMYNAKRAGKNTWRRYSAVASLAPQRKSA